MNRLWVVAVVLVAVGLGSAAAHGRGLQTKKPWRQGVTASQRKAAQRLLRRGNALMVRVEYKKALAAYREALRHWDHPAIQFNIAQCLIHLDRPLDAYRALMRALRYGPAPHSPAHYRRALGHKRSLSKRVAWLTVRCSVPGAQVTVDGKDWSRRPGGGKRLVLSGSHQIVAAKAGFVTSTRRVTLKAGTHATVRLELLSLEGLSRTKRRWKRWIPWTVLGAGIAVASIGLPLILKARAELDAFDNYITASCTQPSVEDGKSGCTVSQIPRTVIDHESSGRAFNQASIAMFAVGGAVIAAGIVLLILNQGRRVTVDKSSKPSANTPSVLPLLRPGEVALSAALRF